MENKNSKLRAGASLPKQRAAQDKTEAMDWRAVWFPLRERFWVLLLCLFLTGALAGWYILATPRTYTASAVIQVEQQPQQIVQVQDVVPEEYKTTEALKTIEQALASRTLAQRVVQANNLKDDPNYGEPDAGEVYSESKLIDILSSRAEFTLRRGTRLIDVAVDDTDPARAQRLAMSFVQEYVRLGFEQRLSVTSLANDFLVKESDRLRARLEKSEQALQAYREEHGTISLEDRQNIIGEELKDLNRNVTQVKSARIKLESDYSTIQNAAAGKSLEELFKLPSVAALPEIAALRQQINTKEAEFALLKERYLEKHPKYLQAEGQLKELRTALTRAAMSAGDSVRQALSAAQLNEKNLTQALREQEKAALALSKITIPYNVLQRDMESDRALFESVLARLKETKLAQGVEKSSVRVVQAAFLPKMPSKPRILRVLAVAIAGGLVLGVGCVLLLDLLDASLRSVDKAEETLGLPCLAVVRKSRFDRPAKALALIAKPAGTEAEAFRTLRAAISLLNDGSGCPTLLFTSALAGEGKSYTAAHYATALALQGKKTLLIDADLRRPGVGPIFLKDKEHPGLTEFLAGTTPLQAVCADTSVPNLKVMPAGKDLSKPAELLSAHGKDFARLLEEAGREFQAVVIDSAPVNAVSDTLLLLEHVPEVCLVVRARKTSARILLRTCQLLRMANRTPIGFVLNRMPHGPGFGYYSYYAGSYTSPGVYGAEKKTPPPPPEPLPRSEPYLLQ